MKRLAAALLTVAAMAAAAVIPGTAAMAAPSVERHAPVPVQITAQMHVTGIDAAVARAHGFVVRTNAAGKQYVARKGSTGVSPNDVVSGDCGSSYMYLYPDGGDYTTAVTGFNVTGPAVSYGWNIVVVDDAGTAHHSWGGGLAFDSSWSGSWTSWHSVSGYSWAEVVSGWAVLWDGDICTSLYPSDSTYVY